MKILEQKIGRFGWNVWLVLDADGEYKIGLLNSAGELYQVYREFSSEYSAIISWEKH